MLTIFYSRGVITVFPEGSFTAFPLIKFLACSSGNQFDGIGNHVPTLVISNK